MRPPEFVSAVGRRLTGSGHRAYLVGGALRDLTMGREPKDWDVATDARPDAVQALFERSIPTGKAFGTITVVSDGRNVEVTTFRSDGKYTDARHPDEVSYADRIEDDLSRRDFTMNAMAMDMGDDSAPLIDPFGGSADIVARIVRAVGDPTARFSEDPLRMVRACRFASKLGFALHEDTLAAACGLSNRILAVSPERIQVELVGMLSADRPSVGLRLMLQTGIMEKTLHELSRCAGVEQPGPYHRLDVLEHTLAVVDVIRNDPTLRLAALFHDCGKPDIRVLRDGKASFIGHEDLSAKYAHRMMTRLKFPTRDIESVCHLVRHHMSLMYCAKWSDSTVRKWINRVGESSVAPLAELRIADIDGAVGDARPEVNGLLERIKNLPTPVVTKRTLAVDGTDVMRELGIPPSRRVGEILDRLEQAVMDDPSLNERDRLIEFMRGVA